MRAGILLVILSIVWTAGRSAAQDNTPNQRPNDQQRPNPQQGQGGGPQGNRRQGPRFADPAETLAKYREQFADVDLTDDQMRKIDEFIEVAERHVKALANYNEFERGQLGSAALRFLDDDVQTVLTEPQKQILRQRRQREMFDNMTKMYTDEKLKLTDAQQAKVKDAIEVARKQAMTPTQQSDDPSGMRQMFEAMNELRQSVSAILTPEQQQQLNPFGRGGPGGGPPRGPGNNNGGPGGPPNNNGGGPGGPPNNGGNNPPPNNNGGQNPRANNAGAGAPPADGQ